MLLTLYGWANFIFGQLYTFKLMQIQSEKSVLKDENLIICNE